jgi:hypothetical protein
MPGRKLNMIKSNFTAPAPTNQSASEPGSATPVESSQTPSPVDGLVNLSINESEGHMATTVPLPSDTAPSQDTSFKKLSDLRLGQEYAAELALNKQQVNTPVRRPNKQSFFRVHISPEMHFNTMVLRLENEGQFYLIDKPLWASLTHELLPMRLYFAITREGDVFFWPVRLPGDDAQLDNWNASAHVIAQQATTSWVRVISNRHLGAYEVISAAGDFGEPDWPQRSLEEWLHLAFKDRIIVTLDHPLLKKLRGEL